MWDKLTLQAFGIKFHAYHSRGRSARIFKLVIEGNRTGRRRI